MHNVDYQQSPRAIHLFAGAGGGLLGGSILGWRTVCAVEIEPFCREVLVARQNDGTLSPFPIWDDVRTFDGKPWKGCCDVLCGGFPCQNVSPLGDRSGIRGEKSGLWVEFRRIMREVSPGWVFIENSSDLVKLGLDVVLQDLDELGYDAEWTCMAAAELGAPHIRDRVWVLAKARRPGVLVVKKAAGGVDSIRDAKPWTIVAEEGVRVLADSDIQRQEEQGLSVAATEELHSSELPGPRDDRRPIRLSWWDDEPGVRRVADGVANCVERLGALGNGQVSYVAARAFAELVGRFAATSGID